MIILASRYALSAIGLTGLSEAAFANDTTVSLAAGGLVFERTDRVEMQSEVLKISTNMIEVDYVFKNIDDHDLTTNVAFPMPDLVEAESYHEDVAMPGAPPNFLDFRTWVDGKEIHPVSDVHVVLLNSGKDITAELDALGTDKGPFSSQDVQDVKVKWLERGWAHYEGPNIVPDWMTKISFLWQQLFPAGKQIHIHHTYHPSVGGGLVGLHNGDWCVEELKSNFEKLPRLYEWQGIDQSYLMGRWVRYVLKTGANWAGPIGQLTLVIDKGDADLVSTCAIPGLTLKREGTSFIATAKNFTPTTDLDILFANGRCAKGEDCPMEDQDPRRQGAPQ